MPDKKTAQLVYDNLDFQRGVSAFLNAIPIASLYAFREGMRDIGAKKYNQVIIAEKLLGSRGLYLTGNTTVNYVFGWLDLKDGPLVVEVPPGVLSLVDNFNFRYVGDQGKAGPDKGKGGKYLFLPPGYKGKVPDGYFIAKSPTYGNGLGLRAFPTADDPQAGVKSVKKGLKIYRLANAAKPSAMEFIDVSDKFINTIHANNFKFFEEVHAVIQEEPSSAFNPETLGLLHAIGIQKDKPFKPNARMKKILTDAAAVGNATARALTFATRDKTAQFFPDRQWKQAFLGGDHRFLTKSGARNLDARSIFHYFATGITPAMVSKTVGVGSVYAYAERDSEGKYLDGGKTYKITLPVPVPAKDF